MFSLRKENKNHKIILKTPLYLELCGINDYDFHAKLVCTKLNIHEYIHMIGLQNINTSILRNVKPHLSVLCHKIQLNAKI